MHASDLIAFEKDIADAFERGEIHGPVHLSGGNEDQLIHLFKEVDRGDWLFSTWRSHFHALLHGIPQEKVMAEILAGRSMNLCFPEHRFYTSAIVGGILPIAVGVAAALKRQGSERMVWCCVGDMAATTGVFHETSTYALRQDLPIKFIVEDNGLSTNTPTDETWGMTWGSWDKVKRYTYKRTVPHCGIGKWVNF